MTRKEQRKLFMEFYGITPELTEWARKKWESGTQSLSQESLSYMKAELVLRERRAEHAREVAALLEQETKVANGDKPT